MTLNTAKSMLLRDRLDSQAPYQAKKAPRGLFRLLIRRAR